MMRTRMAEIEQHQGFTTRYPVSSYFVIAFAIAWAGAFAVAAPSLHVASTRKISR